MPLAMLNSASSSFQFHIFFATLLSKISVTKAQLYINGQLGAW